MTEDLNWNSRSLTKGTQQGIKSFYWGLGWEAADFDKPQIGIGLPILDANLCNLHARELGDWLRDSLAKEGLHGFGCGIPSVSDNITQGHEGGSASLPSRNLIANAAEMVASSHRFDGYIGIHHCDKNGPGFAMALLRMNMPGFIVGGGTIRPGCLDGKPLTIQSSYDAQAETDAGTLSPKERDAIVRNACPGAGGCGIAASFNTWSLAMEVLGLMPSGSASNPAEDEAKHIECGNAGKWMRGILEKGLRPRDIVTAKALANATATIGAIGGSTNGLMHLLAIAIEAEVDFTLRDMQPILRKTPVLCNFAPRGRGTMIDLHKLGGSPALIKRLIEAGAIDGSLPTLFAKSLDQQVESAAEVDDSQTLIATGDKSFKAMADAQVCFGNLAPDGIVFKVSSRQDPDFSGEAICFESVETLTLAAQEKRIKAGHVVVLRGLGPIAAGMPEILVATSALSVPELDGKVALVSDARISGVSHGAIGVHCSPEAAAGGPIGQVADGDTVQFNLEAGTVHWEAKGKSAAAKSFQPYRGQRGYLRDFAASACQADKGCVSRYRRDG